MIRYADIYLLIRKFWSQVLNLVASTLALSTDKLLSKSCFQKTCIINRFILKRIEYGFLKEAPHFSYHLLSDESFSNLIGRNDL